MMAVGGVRKKIRGHWDWGYHNPEQGCRKGAGQRPLQGQCAHKDKEGGLIASFQL